jgi:hypothetical protein
VRKLYADPAVHSSSIRFDLEDFRLATPSVQTYWDSSADLPR